MSNTAEIKEALKDLIINDDKPFVAMLSGEWGIGKTYFWGEFKKEYLADKKVVDVSLFGCGSLQEIEERILTGLYRYNDFVKKYTAPLNLASGWLSKLINIPIQISAGSILSMFKSEDFKNIVICFDDFERLSDKVSLKDVMGLISQFKEQKECKIIMILNEGELSRLSGIDDKPHDEIFGLYKEKIVDYSFHYQPDQEELFKAIEDDINEITFCDHQTIYDFFKKINLKNIRIMKQAIYLLEKFSFVGSQEYDKRVIDEFVAIILKLFVFKAKTNYTYSTYIKIKQYLSDTLYLDTDTENSDEPEYEKYRYLFGYPLSYCSIDNKTEENIYSFLDSHVIDKEMLDALLVKKLKYLTKNEIRDKIYSYYNKARFDFSADLKECAKEIFHLIDENKENIPYTFDLLSTELYLNFIEEHNSSIISQEFRDEIIKKYINLEQNEGKTREFIERNYSHLISYFDRIMEKKIKQNININEIQKKLEKFSTRSSFTPKDVRLLNLLSPDIYKQHIKESQSFYEEVLAFLDIRYGELDQAYSNIKQALKELRSESLDNQWRIKQIKVKLEEEK